MNFRERVLEQIRHRETDFVPYAKLQFEGDVAERLDRHYGTSLWRSRVHRYNHVRELTGMVPLLEWRNEDGRGEGPPRADLFGSLWRTDVRPQHLERPALADPSLAGYRFPRAEEFFRPGWHEDAAEVLAGSRDYFVVAGFGPGLFERTWNLRGFENALADSVAEPGFYRELLERVAALQLQIVAELLRLPIDGILFADDWADQRGIILGPDRWRSLVRPHMERMYEAVRSTGKHVLSHCCGNVREIVPDLMEIGLEVLQSVQPEAMDPYELKRRFGSGLTFWGGLGSQRLIPFGTPQEIRAEVAKLSAGMGRGGGYILGTAKYLQPETPTANAAAVVEAFCAEAGISPT